MNNNGHRKSPPTPDQPTQSDQDDQDRVNLTLQDMEQTAHYQSLSRHCETCNVDFNAISTSKYWCKHDCDSETIAKQIFYVRASEPDDRRSHISYYVMTLNNYPYHPIPAATTIVDAQCGDDEFQSPLDQKASRAFRFLQWDIALEVDQHTEKPHGLARVRRSQAELFTSAPNRRQRTLLLAHRHMPHR